MNTAQRMISVLYVCILLAGIQLCAYAEVTPLRILREHKVTVTTNADVNRLNRAFMTLGFSPQKIIPFWKLQLERDNLKTDGDVLFILDRSQPIGAEEAALIPVPLPSIDPTEVITAVVKKSIGVSRKYKNGWLISIVAPNQQWLDKELGVVPQILNTPVVEQNNIITTLHFYNVQMLNVVTTEHEDVPKDWAEAQMNPQKQAIDITYSTLDNWDCRADNGRSLFFLLNRQNLNRQIKKILPRLPDNIRNWLTDDSTLCEGIAAKGEVQLNDSRITSYAIIAPSERLIRQMLINYTKINSIPATGDRTIFADLSDCGRMAVIAKYPGTTKGDTGLLNDLTNKMLSALASSDSGIESKSYQDIGEIEINQFLEGNDGIAKENVTRISKNIGKSQALMVVSLASQSAQKTFEVCSPQRLTPLYPLFTRSEPGPEDREWLVFGQKKYPKGREDPAFKADMESYERAKNEYEQKRQSYEVEWTVQIDQIEKVDVACNITVYDVRDNSEIAGRVVYSSQVLGSAAKRSSYQDLRLKSIGDDSRPFIPRSPEAENSVSDSTLISQAFEDAANKTVQRMKANCLLPLDRMQMFIK